MGVLSMSAVTSAEGMSCLFISRLKVMGRGHGHTLSCGVSPV